MSQERDELSLKLTAETRARLHSIPRPKKAYPEQRPLWHLVTVPDVGESTVISSDDIEVIRQLLIDLEGQDVSCMLFYGMQASFTGHPFRRLVLPDGKLVPLYEDPAINDAEPICHMGEPEIDVTPAPTDEEIAEEYEVTEEADDDGYADA